MYKRLIKFVDKNKILSNQQYGFRKSRSTEFAIIEVIDKITKAIDQGKYTIGIFLDTINHEILIKKLEYYGMRGIARKLFENYLGNRKQIVKYNQTCSAEAKITSCVPQGSILGPLLFLLYINDIENCSNIVSMILFADETNIYHSHTCLKTLNDIMQKKTKTSVLCFSLSIFNLCQFSLGKYLHKANSEVTKHTKKNCVSNVI